MPGIIDLPKFNYEDLEEIFARWAGNGFEDDKRMVISPILFEN